MKQPNSSGSRPFEVNRIRIATTSSPVKREQSRGIPVSQSSMQAYQLEETKAPKERTEMFKLHNRLSNKKYDSDEDSSPKKQDQEDDFILGSENDGDEYSDDSDKSPLAVNR